MLKWCVILGLSLSFLACTEEPKRSLKKPGTKPVVAFESVKRPVFDADLAYNYIQTQVDFGPRFPGSEGHKQCAEYLEQEMSRLGWQVEVQRSETTAFDGKKIPIYNVISRFNPENKERIMLFAHWDTRPFADRDDVDQNKPILGANDGASGVGVLMSLAKTLMEDSLAPNIGIDFIFFDAEDYGQPSGSMSSQNGNTWCLGSQHWARNLPDNYVKPKYGVLLDMVGGKNAMFAKEAGSLRYNKDLVEKVWYLGKKLGYGNLFVDDIIYGGITDDHVPVSTLGGIPSIDIIHYNPNLRDFGHFHHRHSDNMEIIDRTTLYAVGETMLELIYREG